MTDNALFATAVNCMDGRVQEPAVKFLKNKLGVAYVDTFTMLRELGVRFS